jgi:nicotinamide-nucleotide amidase
MNAIIISIGDELVLGQTVDTNSAWLSAHLATVGCDVSRHLTVRDDQFAIEQAIQYCAARCDYLIISGGIGPTDDDLTRQALAAVLGVELELNDAWLAKLHEFFRARGREMPPTHRIQAMIPRGAKMIENTAGTAAGIDVEIPSPADQPHAGPEYMERMFGFEAQVQGLLDPSSRLRSMIQARGNPTRIFVTPGVPKEMKIMFARDILPRIKEKSGGAVILSRTLHTFGLGESWVAEKLGELMKRDHNPVVGTTVANGIVSVRISSRFDAMDVAMRNLEQTESLVRERLGDMIFGHDDQTLQEVLAASLASSRKTVTTAESCTGGLLAKMLTDVPGSSDYFKMGFITYSNQAKYERLGVSMEIINMYGAVSEPVVDAMARNARRLAKADFALAISGVAGPTGGTPAKPVGMVCIALAFPSASTGEPHREGAWVSESSTILRTFNFPGDREMIRDRSAKMALTMLRFHLLSKPMPF